MPSISLKRVRKVLRFIRRRGRPLGISIDVSGACNLRCEMCVLDELYPEKGMMQFEVFERIAGGIRDIPLVSLSNNCEPTLNKRLPEMVALLKRNNPDVFVTFTTNGTRLNEELDDALIDSGLDSMQVSIDGARKETFEQIRVGAKLDQVLDNVAEFTARMKHKQSVTPALEFVFVASTKTIDELEDVIDLAASHGVGTVNVNGMEPYDEELDAMKLWGADHAPPESVRRMEAAQEHARRKGVRLITARLKAKRVKRCNLAHPIVAWDGSIAPCSPLSYSRTTCVDGVKTTFPQVLFGNIAEAPFYSVWKRWDFVRFRARSAMGVLPEHCRRCLLKGRVTCADDES